MPLDLAERAGVLRSEAFLDRVQMALVTAAYTILRESDNVANAAARKTLARQIVSSQFTSRLVAERARFDLISESTIIAAEDEAAITDTILQTAVNNALTLPRVLDRWLQG